MFKIQDFSLKTGVSKRMLRYLEDLGLLVPHRGENEYRFYDQSHFEEVRWIQFWQRLGFSLAQTRTLKLLSAQKIEEQLENLLLVKKEEALVQSQQLANIRSLIAKLRSGTTDIQKDFSKLAAWSHYEREEFLSRVSEPVRVVYGKFPEIEKLTETFLRELVAAGFGCDLQSCDIMKAEEATNLMESSEVVIWERKSDYTYFMAGLPETVFRLEASEKLEEQIQRAFEASINETFYEEPLEATARLFQSRDLLQYIAPHDIVFKIAFKAAVPDSRFYLFIPFQFVHSFRGGMSAELNQLGRILQRAMIQLSEEQIINRTKSISNEHYLLTALLVDSKTRNRMLVASATLGLGSAISRILRPLMLGIFES